MHARFGVILATVLVDQEKDDKTTVKAVEDAAQTPPDEPANEHHSVQVPRPPVEEREFLQGMSPPISPEGIPSTRASNKDPPSPVALETAAAETESPSPAAHSMMGLEKDGAFAGGSAAVPMVAPSNGGRQNGGTLKPMEAEDRTESTRMNVGPREQLVQPVETQVSLSSTE